MAERLVQQVSDLMEEQRNSMNKWQENMERRLLQDKGTTLERVGKRAKTTANNAAATKLKTLGTSDRLNRPGVNWRNRVRCTSVRRWDIWPETVGTLTVEKNSRGTE